MDDLKNLPPGIVLGGLSASVFAILERHTAFPWPVLVAQCKRLGLDPIDISKADLERLVPHLATGVERFTSPQNGAAVRRELDALVRWPL
jgi:hypothetical protein